MPSPDISGTFVRARPGDGGPVAGRGDGRPGTGHQGIVTLEPDPRGIVVPDPVIEGEKGIFIRHLPP
jgi:hypothetical protein